MSQELINAHDLLDDRFKLQMKLALPKHLTPERMCRIALTEFRKNAKLRECNKASVLGALMKCCELGLEPSSALGLAYLIPYKKECTLIIGYKGLLQLARQSGEITSIYARCVYEQDEFELSYGIQEKLHHVPARLVGRTPGKFIAVYAIAHFKDGSYQFEVMFDDEIQKVKTNTNVWATHPEEMAKKTALRRLCKYLPLSAQIQEAVSLDESADVGKQDLKNTIDAEYDEVNLTPVDSADQLVNQLEGSNERR